MLRIRVKQSSDHSLVLSVVLAGFALEELDTAFAERDSDLDPFVAKDEFIWRWKKIRNDP